MSGLNTSLNLTDTEKLFFIKALSRLAQADNCIKQEEHDFLQQLCSSFNIPATQSEAIKSITDAELINEAKQITNRQTAMELIKEMCMLANTDGDISERETMLIGQIGLAMNLELEKIEQISRWVIDRIIWLEEGKIIFEKV